MALTRKALKAMGLTDEQVDSIIEMHSETVNGLKAESDKYRADADALPDLKKKLADAEKQIAENGKDSWKVKYDALKEDFEGYKTEQTKKATAAVKEKAYRALLKEAGVSEKRLDAVMKVTNLDGMELDGDKLKDADKLTAGIKSEWSDFIQTTSERGADVSTPPDSGNNTNYDDMDDATYYATVLKKGDKK